MPDRAADVGRARTLSIASVLWGAIAAVAGAAIGISTGSLATIGFAVDSAIDSVASVALVWRFAIERRDPERAARVEHIADRVVGSVLILAAIFLALGAARALLAHDPVAPSAAQVALLALSLVVLPPLAIAKRRVAIRLGSTALKNDALLTAAAALLAAVALVALALEAAGLWWADAVGSLIIAAVLAREGWDSVSWGGST